MPGKRVAGFRKPATVVHLGNIGERKALLEKTRNYAKRFPGFRFVGIDIVKHIGPNPKNLEQIKADFRTGLERLRDGSVAVISSEMALGYYNAEGSMSGMWPDSVLGHTHKTLIIAYTKLRRKGKIMIVVGKNALPTVKKAFEDTGFEKQKTTIKPLTEKEKKRTQWIRSLSDKTLKRKGELYQVVAEK